MSLHDLSTLALAIVVLASLVLLFVLVADSRALARARLTAGATRPCADCPNHELFDGGR